MSRETGDKSLEPGGREAIDWAMTLNVITEADRLVSEFKTALIDVASELANEQQSFCQVDGKTRVDIQTSHLIEAYELLVRWPHANSHPPFANLDNGDRTRPE